jgi:hypothetical protein
VRRYWHKPEHIQQFSIFTFREYGETMNVQTQPDLIEFEFAFLPQFFQLIKTGSASSDVREQVGELSVRRLLASFSRTSRPGQAMR